MNNRFTLTATLAKFRAAKAVLPTLVARIAENQFKDNFVKQGFEDLNVDPWREVQRRMPGTKAYKYAKAAARSRAILVGRGSGRLKRDIKAVKVTPGEVKIATSVPYAKAHNEGTGRIPKRKFMGKSKSLNNKLRKEITTQLKRAFK